jgi:hypothetical protein
MKDEGGLRGPPRRPRITPGMRLPVAWLLALSAAASAADKDVEALRQKARAEVESGKNTWDRFVFEADAVSDGDLSDLVDAYDRAIDFYQRIAEACEEGDGEADVGVIRLARKTAKLRATIWAREMAEKAKAAASRPKEPVEVPAEEPREPEAKPPAPPPDPPPAVPEPVVLPTIEESREERSRGIQGARNFVMQYCANRKYKSMIGFCGKATCNACRARVGHLNIHAARKAYWLCWSPLYRANDERKAKWQARFREWRIDPRKLPEVLTRLSITKVDYHGLWAEVEWEQWGVTNDARKTHDKVTRRIVRAGNRWFFFDEELDRDFFAPPSEGPERR